MCNPCIARVPVLLSILQRSLSSGIRIVGMLATILCVGLAIDKCVEATSFFEKFEQHQTAKTSMQASVLKLPAPTRACHVTGTRARLCLHNCPPGRLSAREVDGLALD